MIARDDYPRASKMYEHIVRKCRKKIILIKFGLFEKGTKFEKLFHLKFDVTD